MLSRLRPQLRRPSLRCPHQAQQQMEARHARQAMVRLHCQAGRVWTHRLPAHWPRQSRTYSRYSNNPKPGKTCWIWSWNQVRYITHGYSAREVD